jgi:hypothetical protein
MNHHQPTALLPTTLFTNTDIAHQSQRTTTTTTTTTPTPLAGPPVLPFAAACFPPSQKPTAVRGVYS